MVETKGSVASGLFKSNKKETMLMLVKLFAYYSCVVCWKSLQIGWTQMFGLILIQSVWHSKELFEKDG